MSLDLTVLRLLKYRERFDRLVRAVPKHAMDDKTQTLLADFRAFFQEFPEVTKIESDNFLFWFLNFRHPKLTPEAIALYTTFIKRLEEDVSEEVEAGLMERLVAHGTAFEVTNTLLQYHEGDEVDLYVSLRDAVEKFESQINRKVKTPMIEESIHELLTVEQNEEGIHYRLTCLNDSLRPMQPGDAFIIAARPDAGKTSFLASEATYWAKQMDTVFPDEERCVLWLNNEGPGRRIITRTYQAALGATMQELSRWSLDGSLDERYLAAIGRTSALRVCDIHDFSWHEVEDVIRTVKPGVIIFDMIDNIRFGGDLHNGGSRTDQLLEMMYQKARNAAVKYGAVSVATSQVSAEGEGMPYPTMDMLKDSKTGKQGACDAIIVIGKSNEDNLVNSRFIGAPKNKLHRNGANKLVRTEVTFDGQRARFNMPD